MRTLAIIGSGDLGQQIAHYALSDKHYDTVVFFDDFTTQTEINGCLILGKTSEISKAFEAKQFDELIIGIGYKHLQVRKELFEKFSSTIPFGTIIHSSSWIDTTAVVEKGCVIYPGCIIDANTVIHTNTILNIGCTIAHDTHIGSHCFLSPRVAVAGFVTVQESCILGINSTIIDNLNIVAHTQLGGATIVIKSIEKSGLYVGNPAKFIR
ncbi:acetyltransferase [Flavobacterium luminosum]|uniref:Acetyltransferase n=1 Tax=Flavobacterium luminosum TaxID=2949086 RepID=A0ABT0TPV5_9FLAO|nr:acetyltransferase [Flavobacterium sp. HXWNR70]MCL9809099.1 acetyltransferase [Flavobacterium sp. HXWNR70]